MNDRLDDARGILDFYKNSQDMQACSSLPLGTLRWLVAEVDALRAALARVQERRQVWEDRAMSAEADLARARAVLDGSYDAGPSESGKTHTLIVDAAAWVAWKAGPR